MVINMEQNNVHFDLRFILTYNMHLIVFSLAMLLGFGANRLQASILMWKFI